MKKFKKSIYLSFFFSILLLSKVLAAETTPTFPVNIDFNQFLTAPQISNSIQLLVSLAFISLIPFFLICTTSFIRIVIVFGMTRVAVGTQQVPPNQALIGMALFMTIFIMSPVWQEVNTKALTPYNQGKITQAQAFERGLAPLRQFMFRQTREADLALFVKFAKIDQPQKLEDIPTYVMIPAFMISELKTAFQIGFTLFIPFLVVDLVVANILLSLGMFMLSPVMVSLPFKVLLFVLADGWHLITQGLMLSFK